MLPLPRRGLCLLVLLLPLVSGVWLLRVAGQEPSDPPAESSPLSATARRVYEQASPALVQVRTLLQGQDTQASVGSGFLVSADGHVVTNYHVVSQAALEPERYRLVFATQNGRAGALQLLAFDALHDVALVRVAEAGALAGRTPLTFRPVDEPLAQGDRIYSLGKPLDVGFAVAEGTYNDLVERSFYSTIFFGGSLNPGVSGGPTLDDRGRVIGVNVATRIDGEQTSFLVPATFAADLLARSRDNAPVSGSAYPALTAQLTAHQDALVSRFLAQPWRPPVHPRYRIPEPEETFMRCWGHRSDAETKGLAYSRTDCAMESHVFVSGALTTGFITLRHEAYDGTALGTLRFADRYSKSFQNEDFVAPENPHLTATRCHERYVDRDGLPVRAVLCLAAYKKLTGLYQLGLLVATVDAPQQAVLGRFDADGVTFDNALALAGHYLAAFGPADRGAPAP
jgi:S1-C subfamily serine protease